MKLFLLFLHLLCTWSIPLEELTGRKDDSHLQEKNSIDLEEPHRPKNYLLNFSWQGTEHEKVLLKEWLSNPRPPLTYEQEVFLGMDELSWQSTESEKAVFEEWLSKREYGDLALIDDPLERNIAWAGYYFERFGELPVKIMRTTLGEIWKGMKAGTDAWKQFKQDQLNDPYYLKLDKKFKAGEITATQRDNTYLYQVKKFVAEQIAANFYAVDKKDWKDLAKTAVANAQGKKKSFLATNSSSSSKKFVHKMICEQLKAAALRAFQSGAKDAVAKGKVSSTGKLAAQTQSSISNGKELVSKSVGTFLGAQVAGLLNISHPTIVKGFEDVGAIAFGAIQELGGPIRVALQNFKKVLPWGLDKVIDFLFRIGRGPDDNWAYIQTGPLPKGRVSAGTYGANDILRVWTKWLENLKPKNEIKMSASQPVKDPFQLYVWYKAKGWWTSATLAKFDKVYYRDVIQTVMHKNSTHGLRTVIFYGENHPKKAGQTFIAGKQPITLPKFSLSNLKKMDCSLSLAKNPTNAPTAAATKAPTA